MINYNFSEGDIVQYTFQKKICNVTSKYVKVKKIYLRVIKILTICHESLTLSALL